MLLVDDEPEILQTLKLIIKSGGHDVITAESGILALDILDSDAKLDLLLTDVIMPGLNGFSLARMALLRRPELRIMYLTGFYEQVKVLGNANERFGNVLIKPLLSGELRAAVDAAFSAI
ncbi:MAG TPA: response regulator [Stellaceae bacterium]|nr:response regulator [Stellaceae bacterium]